jgi:hypothetical protein
VGSAGRARHRHLGTTAMPREGKGSQLADQQVEDTQARDITRRVAKSYGKHKRFILALCHHIIDPATLLYFSIARSSVTAPWIPHYDDCRDGRSGVTPSKARP